jgi:alpha-beta hydrolase superfamily lysophospholipase
VRGGGRCTRQTRGNRGSCYVRSGTTVSSLERARRRSLETLKLYDGHVHDLLNDMDKEIVMRDILQWIDARLPAVPR